MYSLLPMVGNEMGATMMGEGREVCAGRKRYACPSLVPAIAGQVIDTEQ